MTLDQKIASWALIVAVLALAATVVFAILTIRRSNKTASAALLISLHESLRLGWKTFLCAPEEQKSYEFAELINLMEVAAALCLDGAVTDRPKQLFDDYLVSCLVLLAGNNTALSEVRALCEKGNTFEYLRAFELAHGDESNSFSPIFS